MTRSGDIFRTASWLVMAILPGVAQAETLRDALVSAYLTNPTLNAQRAQLRSVDENVAVARAQRLPQVSGNAGFSQNTQGIGTLRNGGRAVTASANMSLPIYTGGRIANSIHAADARVIGGRADLRATEGNVFANTVSAYMDVIRDTAIVELNRKQVEVLDTNLQASRDRFQVGDLTKTDVAQSEARLSVARSQLATAEGTLQGTRENYRRVVGYFPGDLAPPPPLPMLPATSDAATDIALTSNPAIASITAQAQAAGYDVRVARAGRLPTLSANAGLNYTNYLGTLAQSVGLPGNTPGLRNEEKYSTVGVTATVPIFQGGLIGARVRQARDVESQTLEQGVETERAVVAQARSAFASYQASAETIKSSESAVSANELALEGVKAENGVGTRTVLDVLNAEQELLNSKVQLVTARRDNYVAGFNLLNAMGRAEMRYLGLDGGALYDPVLNYDMAHGQISDFADGPEPRAVSTRTVDQPAANTPNPVTKP